MISEVEKKSGVHGVMSPGAKAKEVVRQKKLREDRID